MTMAIRLATLATVPVKSVCSAVNPVSKGDPPWAWAVSGTKTRIVIAVRVEPANLHREAGGRRSWRLASGAFDIWASSSSRQVALLAQATLQSDWPSNHFSEVDYTCRA